MKLNKKLLLVTSGLVTLAGLTIAGFVHWAQKPFRPVLMNFESYLDPDAEKEISEKFQYKAFSELNEFSRAIESDRIVGGISSDFEIARLIIGDKIQKIDFTKILRNIPELNNPNSFDAKGRLKKSVVAKYWRPETMKHVDSYNKYLVNYKNERIDNDNDGIADEMWEYLIPYYIQDKVVAYTTGTDNKERPLRPDSFNTLTDEEKENGIRFEDQTFVGIMKKLSEKKYNRFGWTEASRDNLLIGSELKNSDAPSNFKSKIEELLDVILQRNDVNVSKAAKNAFLNNINTSLQNLINKNFSTISTFGSETYSGYVTPSNYKSMIEGFLEVVKNGTGGSVNDVSKNAFVSNGTELLQSLIDKNSRNDVAVMYNGDAIDAIYSSDNFSDIPDGQIKYIRPKHNITLMEGFVLRKSNSEELNNDIYDVIFESIYKGVNQPKEEVFQEILTWEQVPFFKKNEEGEWEAETDLDNPNMPLMEKNGKKNYALYLDYSNVPILRNYDYVNYTPAWKNDFEIMGKWYFNDAQTYFKALNADGSLAGEDSENEETAFLHDANGLITIALDANLEDEALEEKLTEAKAKYNTNNIAHEVSDKLTESLLNIYITQQPEQTVYGGQPTTDTDPADIYKVEYQSIKPISDKLRSEVISEYNLRTKK
ncbi:hypothetical protein ACW95P_01670 [Candidatus Mycoplasma pogonae]